VLYESVRSDKPLNQFARELLTASGSGYANPAANYWRAVAIRRMPRKRRPSSILGIRIQCAKCHNHPSTLDAGQLLRQSGARFVPHRPQGRFDG